jgi:hypothetical protein
MGKMIGIVLVVLGVWVGLEVYTEGTGNAFGGRLAFLSKDEPGGGQPATQRVRTSLERDHAQANARRERMLVE